jgi:leucyl aminopeptidase
VKARSRYCSTASWTGPTAREVEATLNGESPDLVVTAHLDSTAKGQPPFSAEQDPAPGADDDASGMAAVLTAAWVLQQLAR